MYVLTIKFNPTATKTYDYLLVNPKGATINTSRPLRIVTGAGRGSVSWKELTVVNKIRTDVLPDWVTSQIVLDEDNNCTTERISAAHVAMLRRKAEPVIVSAHEEVSVATPKKGASPKAPVVVPYKARPIPKAIQDVIDRQRQIRQETIAMCQRIFNNK